MTHPWRALAACIAIAQRPRLGRKRLRGDQGRLVKGEQNVFVTRPGDGVQAALQGLLAGPTAAERKTQIRTYMSGRDAGAVRVAAGVRRDG